jgi:hypothetical protein
MNKFNPNIILLYLYNLNNVYFHYFKILYIYMNINNEEMILIIISFMIGFFINKMLLKNNLLEGQTPPLGPPLICKGNGRYSTGVLKSCSDLDINTKSIATATNSCKKYFSPDFIKATGMICDGTPVFKKGHWYSDSHDHYVCSDGNKCFDTKPTP